MAKTQRRVSTPSQRERRQDFREKLELVNALVWRRDNCKCAVCGSTKIVGVPFKSGAHHVFGRNARPDLRLVGKYLALLCEADHRDNANTKPFQAKLLKILRDKYGYSYENEPEAQWLIDEFYKPERLEETP